MIKVGDSVYAKLVVKKVIQDSKGISYYLTDSKDSWEHITLRESEVAMKVTGEEICCGEDLCKS